MKSFKIIHVFNDDKFVDVAIKLFEIACPNQSHYWINSKNKQPFKYVTSKLAKPIFLNEIQDNQKFVDYVVSMSNIVVFLHALDAPKQSLVNRLPENIVKIWFLWGYDFYRKWPLLKNNNLEFYTNKKFKKKQSLKQLLIYNSLTFYFFKNRKMYGFLIPKKVQVILENNFNTEYYRAVLKIDAVAPVVPTEFNLVKKVNPKIKFVPFTYGSIEDLLGEFINKNVIFASNILVGNSADPTNNHLDVFIKLSRLNLRNRKVVVPLSYGGSIEYRDQIISEGKRLLGHNFLPITEFMSLKDYNKLLISCGTLIFNHVRQQGVGNIISMGYLGAKLFINEKSPVYKFFKNEGIVMNSIQELDQMNLNSNLTEKSFHHNKTVLYKLYSEEKSIKKIKDLIDVVERILNSKS